MTNPGKQRLSSPVRAAAPLQAAAAHAGGLSADASSPRQAAQGAQIAQLQSASPVAQLAGGKKHHDPEKKKHLAKGVGKKQNETSARALAIKKASPTPMTNKEAKRQAK
ncbi:hypothetical protein [Paucibacter sp. DJ2R-2]|uniref:hypothetical protein n=1 Tax=Paucibacter sp. DJ2R-2 TaxID=2893558 RepID=UPI0021E3FD43|nr:hypothetical protein [Paucibacter sp. DJ2R-2]MCV2423495.1 hypothetical protein [Paucibacter sp. DJ4R-1]MCV2440547.1 hypothetical protein [Paucibacter sp. DJ2R-2]